VRGEATSGGFMAYCTKRHIDQREILKRILNLATQSRAIQRFSWNSYVKSATSSESFLTGFVLDHTQRICYSLVQKTLSCCEYFLHREGSEAALGKRALSTMRHKSSARCLTPHRSPELGAGPPSPLEGRGFGGGVELAVQFRRAVLRPR
jgi:hypothetical protein